MRRERLAQAGAPRRQVPGEQRMVLRETRLGAERLLEDRAVEPLGERDQRAPAPRSRRPRSRALGAVEQPASASTAAGSAARERSRRCGPTISCGAGAGADQSSIGTITSAGPRCGERGVVGADDRARHVLGTRGLLARTPGTRPPARRSRPARNGSSARWRRSCWPTMTTSGARLAARWRSPRRRCPAPACCAAARAPGGREPSAWPIAIDTTEPSCSASTKRQVLGEPGQERHLGRARVGEDRRQFEPAQDVERGSRGRSPSRRDTVPANRLKFSCERSTLAALRAHLTYKSGCKCWTRSTSRRSSRPTRC